MDELALRIAAVNGFLFWVVDANPILVEAVGYACLLRPLVVINGAVAIDEMTHEVECAVAPVDAEEVGEKAGVDGADAEIKRKPAAGSLQAASGSINDRESGMAVFPSFVVVWVELPAAVLIALREGRLRMVAFKGGKERSHF